MRELDPEFGALALPVRFVVIGDRAKVDAFCGPLGMSERCIPDETKASFKAMGFDDYNLLKLFTDPALKQRRKENKAAGFSQNWAATKLPDSAQLPGAALIDAEGTVRWLYAGKHPGDLPPMREMLAVARDLRSTLGH